ncbi:MAG: ATP-binding protein [Prolixibacteraceae bacterium]|nr:ATP-binding protein [Prolixibacteraceae bacterium]
MNELYLFQEQIIRSSKIIFRRDFIDQIEWNDRLVGLIGARGVGKTTLMLQHLKENTVLVGDSLYITADNLSSPLESIFKLAESFYQKGGKRLYVDEIHKYPQWSLELKNIYDLLPDLKVVFSGSSMLKILGGETDLSRRAVVYQLPGLSFREYLQITLSVDLPKYTIDELVNGHEMITRKIIEKIKPLQYFPQYLRLGYYPFFLESENTYALKLNSTLNYILENEISGILRSDIKTIQKFKRLLHIIASNVPFQPNVTKLAESLDLNRNTLLTYLNLLNVAEITHSIYSSGSFYGKLSKPEKILLYHPNISYCLNAETPNSGSIRESFVVNQLKVYNKVELSSKADFLVNERYTFEVGGKGKSRRQILGIPESYIVADDLVIGYQNTIPLWLFGFLY